MARYRLSRAARDDVTEIVAYIATDSTDAALAMNERLEQTFAVLAQNPMAGRERTEFGVQIRSFPTGSYVTLYRPSAGEVLILLVMYAARDLDSEF